jgi:hypothetical protein
MSVPHALKLLVIGTTSIVYAGQVFPVCRKCGNDVRFILTLSVASSDIGLRTVTDADFPWGVYALVPAA